jgi:hypothetical protein
VMTEIHARAEEIGEGTSYGRAFGYHVAAEVPDDAEPAIGVVFELAASAAGVVRLMWRDTG